MTNEIHIRQFLIGILVAAIPLQVFAYLDPGTGSIIVQSLIAVVIAVSMYLRQIKAFIYRLFSRKSPPPQVVKNDPAPSSEGSKGLQET